MADGVSTGLVVAIVAALLILLPMQFLTVKVTPKAQRGKKMIIPLPKHPLVFTEHVDAPRDGCELPFVPYRPLPLFDSNPRLNMIASTLEPEDFDCAKVNLKFLKMQAVHKGLLAYPRFPHPHGTIMRFKMAVHDFAGPDGVIHDHDIISDLIAAKGYIEHETTGTLLQQGLALSCQRRDVRPVFLDIGANIGWYTLTMLAAGFEVWAFEPFGPNLDLLKASLCMNPEFLPRVKIFPYALTDKTDNCILASKKLDYGNAHLVCDKDLPTKPGPNDDPKKTPLQRYLDTHDLLERGKVKALALDQVAMQLPSYSWMKVDIEGHELNFLQGAQKFLRSEHRPMAITTEAAKEMHAGQTRVDVARQLLDWGYHVFYKGKQVVPQTISTAIGHAPEDIIELDAIRTDV